MSSKVDRESATRDHASTKSDSVSLDTDNNTSRRGKDRFGFWIMDNFHQALSVSDKKIKERKEKESERTKKWLKMTKDWKSKGVTQTRQVKRRIRKGVPDALRSFVWCYLAGIKELRAKYPNPTTDIDTKSLTELTIDEVSSVISFRPQYLMRTSDR